jgi:hypothetical protein
MNDEGAVSGRMKGPRIESEWHLRILMLLGAVIIIGRGAGYGIHSYR